MLLLEHAGMNMISSSGRAVVTSRRQHSRAFWTVAYVFAVTMAFAAAPAPLYILYSHEEDLSSFAITTVFAAYAVGVAVSLYFVGHLSDRFGRLRLIAAAVLLNIAAGLFFVVWHQLDMLLIARFISGVGIGMLTATATAYMSDLYRLARPGRPTTLPEIISTAANIGGIGLGPLASGLLAQFAPRPLFTPYIVFLFLMIAGLLAVMNAPETVAAGDASWRYLPQRVSVPTDGRAAFAVAAVVAFVSFAMFGFFTSLAPSFLSNQLHQTSHLLAGLLSFLVFGSAAVAQIFSARLRAATFYPVGLVGLTLGLAITVAGILAGSLPGLVGGGIVVGVGAGVSFKAAVSEVIRIAPEKARGETLAGLFMTAYLGLSVPVVLLGIMLELERIDFSIITFSILMLALLAVAAAMITFGRLTPRRA